MKWVKKMRRLNFFLILLLSAILTTFLLRMWDGQSTRQKEKYALSEEIAETSLHERIVVSMTDICIKIQKYIWDGQEPCLCSLWAVPVI